MSLIAPLVLPLFAYGTLLDSKFTSHLLERPVLPEPARLVDFELLSLPGLPYPVIQEAPGNELPGRIYRHLLASDFDRLDAYEGVAEGLYRRITAEVVPGTDAAGPPPASQAAAGPPQPGREQAFVYVPTGETLRRYS